MTEEEKEFWNNYNWSALWEEEKPSDLFRFLPLVSAILNLIILILIIIKK